MTMNVNLSLLLKSIGTFVPYVQIAETLIENGIALGHQMQHFAAESGVTLQEWADARDQNKVSLDDEIRKLGGTVPRPQVDPEPPKTNDKGFPLDQYNTSLSAMPDVKKLDEGDVVYQLPAGSFYVAMHGFGLAGVPGADWRKIWPEG